MREFAKKGEFRSSGEFFGDSSEADDQCLKFWGWREFFEWMHNENTPQPWPPRPRVREWDSRRLRSVGLDRLGGGAEEDFVDVDFGRFVDREGDHAGEGLGGHGDFADEILGLGLDFLIADVLE